MKKFRYSLAALVSISLLHSCTKFDDNINVSPNYPTNTSNATLLTYAETQLQYTTESPYGILFAQQLSEKIYTDASRYTTVNYDYYWIYTGPLMNLNLILNSNILNDQYGSKNNQLAVARILKAYFFWHATDRWGDLPYKEALAGEKNYTPVYDTQQSIYTDLLKELKEAAAQIDNGAGVAGDIMYGGDMDKWRKLANTLRMLVAQRLSKITPDIAQAEFADAYANGGFTGNDDNWVYRHIAETANQNYWYYVFSIQNRLWYCISEPLVNYMKPYGDPRLSTYADPNEDGAYVGLPYGLDANAAAGYAPADVSYLGAAIRKQDAPSYLVTYGELLLAQAEAAKKGWISGGDATAAADYNAAITASVAQWNNGDTTGVGAYKSHDAIAYDAANALKQIGYQRWVHLYMNGYEAWAEWRRTGYPELQPAPNNNNQPVPRRQGYPTTEPNINTANYKKAIDEQPGLNGKDDLNGRVWWDKQ
ncbi:SusD/RagB family nutrient-binding outer membrane lipoprotein [Deminuibacter soli]|uniref:SusD/RagB family nutrient-binding outer membrane lipoprotein n=1 Tax=Deminuibacter soli TaxID=2291815 RepID=A0A3E1NIH9_9BACT|nr:SusD/RagB family nutrient-binding outer membrane lipoprotein [Deminuibacter soli]RFM27756.1 SusD/RagB family nutrient-binding outer membrane lipoprotein [Deminuibacter soli]